MKAINYYYLEMSGSGWLPAGPSRLLGRSRVL